MLQLGKLRNWINVSKTASKINSPANCLEIKNQPCPGLGTRLSYLQEHKQLPGSPASFANIVVYPVGKLSGNSLLAQIGEIPSKMRSAEFDPVIFCCVRCGEFEVKCVCSKVPRRIQKAGGKLKCMWLSGMLPQSPQLS